MSPLRLPSILVCEYGLHRRACADHGYVLAEARAIDAVSKLVIERDAYHCASPNRLQQAGIGFPPDGCLPDSRNVSCADAYRNAILRLVFGGCWINPTPIDQPHTRSRLDARQTAHGSH